MNEQVQEIRYLVGEAWKGEYNPATPYGNANVVQDPTGLSVYRSLKPGNVGHPLTDANWWFCIINLSSIKAESDRIAALNTAIAQDEALRVAAEQLRQQKESEREAAETQRNEAEQNRINAEQQRVANESQRETKEQQRITAEQGRVTAENNRVAAEQARVQAETLRDNAEDERVLAETNRAAAEQQRIANEQARISQEQQRETKEAERQQTFVQSQAARQQAYEQAEATRQQTFNENEQQRDAQAAALQTKLENGEVIPARAGNLGNGICTTGTYDAAKTVNIPHFMLLENGTINVLFTTPINTENSTLNVSLTGAKPIRILGQNLPAGVIKAETYVTMAYDGTAWNIVNLFCPDAQFDPAALVVDMGLPSGVKWASRDIDLTKPGGFCETPFTYEKSFFSWGNIDGHNPISTSAFDYDWGGVNAQEPWYEGQPYGSTPGNTLTGNIAVGEDFDAARANLGAPWRMPTTGEYAELFANIRYINADGTPIDSAQTNKLVTVNGVVGLYLESTINGARLFFSCSGSGNGRSWGHRGSYGLYWSSSWNSARNARNLYFHSGGVYPQYGDGRCYGFAVRPVQ